MAGSEQGAGDRYTSVEESRRQAEAAFGGAVEEAPPGLGAEARPSGLPGAGEDRRRRRVRRLVVAFLVFDLVVAALVGAGLLIASLVDDAGRVTRPSATPPSVPAAPRVPARPRRGGARSAPAPAGSYLSTRGARRGLATARRLAGAGARVELARIASTQVQVVARRGQRRRIVVVSPALTRAIDAPGGPATGNDFPFGAIDPRVPARLDRAIPRPLDYLVVVRNPVEGRVQWLAYPRGGGPHWEADARGRSLRRVG